MERVSGRKRSRISDDEVSNKRPKTSEINQKALLSHQDTLRKQIHQINKKNRKKSWLKPKDEKLRLDARIALRESTEDAVERKLDLLDPMNSEFLKKTKEQNEIFQMVNHPEEATLDINLTAFMSGILLEQTRSLSNAQLKITPQDLVNKINSKYGNNWEELGNDVSSYFFTIPPIKFLNGPIQQCMSEEKNQEKKKRKPIKRRNLDIQKLTKPSEIQNEVNKNKTETKSRVQNVKKQIRKLTKYEVGVQPEPINLITTLQDPNSFSRTVENYFDFSFIMKDGSSMINIDPETQQPMISYVDTASAQKFKELHVKTHKKKLTTSQCIVKLDYVTWKNITKCYNVKSACIQSKKKESVEVNSEEETSDDGTSKLYRKQEM